MSEQLNHRQRLGLALAAMYSEVNGMDHDYLTGRKPGFFGKLAAKRMLKGGWGVKGHDDLVKAVTWLYEEGHRVEYAENGKKPDMILAWDLCRLINIVRFGVQVGYMGEEEAWEWITRSADIAAGTFKSWKEVGKNFLRGRAFWMKMRGMDEDDNDEFDEAIEELLDPENEESPWNQISLRGATAAAAVPAPSEGDDVDEESRYFTKSGEEVNAYYEDQSGEESFAELMDAVTSGETAKVKDLISKGVNVNDTDDDGVSPLSSAIYYDQAEIVKLLLNAGADPNGLNENDEPLLIYAVDQGYANIVKELLAKGANPNVKNDDGLPVLMIALSQENNAIIKAIIGAGADLNAEDEDGQTILTYCIDNENAAQVKTLVEAGADVNKKNGDGYTPLELAEEREAEDIIRILKKAKAK